MVYAIMSGLNTINFMIKFKHDCKTCVFLGTILAGGKQCDLYYCSNEPTVIARYSDEPGDYSSGLAFGKIESDCTIAELAVAKGRAFMRGLMPWKKETT